jgi:tetratricopeptide (TPR) repeat protein
MGAQITKNGRAFDYMELRIDNDSTSPVTAGCSARGKTDFFDKIIEIILVGLLAFMPILFGAVQAWSEELVIITASFITVLFCCKLVVYSHQQLVRTWAYAPVVIFILITALQLVPLPKAIVSTISPNTAALRTELLGNMPGSDNYLKWMPLSLYPAATKHDFRLVLSASVIFIVVLNVFRKSEQIKRLLWSIAVIGGLVASVTLAQNIFGNGKIYWFISTPNSQGYSGPFINHSNYGQFMNLSIAAALGVLIVRLREVFAGGRVDVSQVFDFISSTAARGIWFLIVIISICLATVFLSLTRGGIISMLVAMFFTAFLMARAKSLRRQSWLFVAVFLIAFGCVLYAGFDAVCERLVSLRDFKQADSGRIQILKDIAVSSEKFPLLGTGLGTHRYVYPALDRSYIVPLAAHAENEYAQALEETGFFGLGALLVIGIMVGRQYLKSIRNKHNLICSAAYGLGFGIVAILVHSTVDFGQHLPANGFLTVTFCALMLVLGGQTATSTKPCTAPSEAAPRHSHKWLRLTATTFVCLILSWAARGADNYRIAERHWNKAQAIRKELDKAEKHEKDYQYSRLIQHAQAAVEKDPENIRYRYWLNVYIYKTLSVSTDPYDDEIMVSQEQMGLVREIACQLRQVCMLCPTYGPAYSMLGQIEKFVFYDQSGSDHINKGFRLAKNDPVVCFVAGCSDASEGDINSATEKFIRAVKLDGRLYQKVAAIYIDRLSRPDLAIAAAGRNTEHLYDAFIDLEEAQYTDYAQNAQQRLIEILKEKCNDGSADARDYRMLGIFYKSQGLNETAIICYRQALQRRYDQVNWRFELADLLAECDKAKEAMDEARICLQLKPEFTAAKNLLAECSVHPSVLKESINQH